MGLEVATYVSQLVPTNPLVGDPVSQGDDHLRLLKGALQNTFPNASKALFFPTTVASQTSTVNVAAADAGKLYPVDASGAARTVNLPATPPDGFEVTIVKTDNTEANLVTISPPGGIEINDETDITLKYEFESARCIYFATLNVWLAMRSAKGQPFDSDQATAKVWPIANGGSGQATAYEAFDAFSPARVDVASAATIDLDAAQSSYVRVTGTTTITAVTLTAGRKRWVFFNNTLTLTHGASLLLPGGANIVTVSGDTLLFIGEAAGIVRCQRYSRGGVIPYEVPARAYNAYTTNADITAIIPLDDTIPQSGEGTQILSQAITLKRATSRVRIRVRAWGQCYESPDDWRQWIMSLFRNGTANALSAMVVGARVNGAAVADVLYNEAVIEFEEAPGSVGPHTYEVNVGVTASSQVLRLNGTVTARLFGGSSQATIVIEEIFV